MIDTTFALYRPGAKGGVTCSALRTGGQLLARHVPWYENPSHLLEETRYYLNSATSASSWYATVKGENKQYLD
jgi:hypothetical protein